MESGLEFDSSPTPVKSYLKNFQNFSFVLTFEEETSAMETSRSISSILADLNPKKSAAIYDKRWDAFLNFLGERQPDEEALLKFFDHLSKDRGYKASSLWSWYSCINAKYSIMHGQKLQSMPRLQALMKSFNAGYVRKTAKTFTRDEIYAFLALDGSTPKCMLVKAAACIGFCGGLRMCELRSLNISSLKESKIGYIVNYTPGKIRGESTTNTFLIKRNDDDQRRCMFSHVKTYLDALLKNNITEGPLFRTCLKAKFSTLPMGHNTLAKCGIFIAEALELPHAKHYTGHCLRRSAASAAADAGATTMDMQRHMNWKNQGTALRYVDNSILRLQRMSTMICGDQAPTAPQGMNEATSKDDNEAGTRSYQITVQPGATLNLY